MKEEKLVVSGGGGRGYSSSRNPFLKWVMDRYLKTKRWKKEETPCFHLSWMCASWSKPIGYPSKSKYNTKDFKNRRKCYFHFKKSCSLNQRTHSFSYKSMKNCLHRKKFYSVCSDWQKGRHCTLKFVDRTVHTCTEVYSVTLG
jgi:hypothetical protein